MTWTPWRSGARRRAPTPIEPFREILLFPVPSAGQQHFEGEWIPTTNDVGTETRWRPSSSRSSCPSWGSSWRPRRSSRSRWSAGPRSSRSAAPRSPRRRPRLLASASTCEDAWTGNGSSLHRRGPVPIDAQVKWIVDSSQTVPGTGIVAYYPTGTVGVHSWVTRRAAPVSYSPSATRWAGRGSRPTRRDGMLVVDFNQVPATYSGSGLTEWTSSMTTACPDGSGGTVAGMITGGLWFNGVGDVSADGLTIQGPRRARSLPDLRRRLQPPVIRSATAWAELHHTRFHAGEGLTAASGRSPSAVPRRGRGPSWRAPSRALVGVPRSPRARSSA